MAMGNAPRMSDPAALVPLRSLSWAPLDERKPAMAAPSPPRPEDASPRSSGCRLGPARWPARSFGARHAPMRRADRDLAAGDRHEASLDLTEKLGRQLSVIAAVRVNGPQIRPRPREPVAFRQDDPGALGVELQAVFHRGRNLDRVGRIGRRRMG